MVDDLLNFNNFGFNNNLRISQIDFLNDCVLWSLDNWFFNNLCNFYDSFLEEWNLYNLLYFLDNFSVLDNNSVSDNFDFFDSVLDNDFFSNNWDFIRLSDNCVGLNDLFNDLWYLDNFLNSLNDWNWLFYDSVNNLISDFDMIFDFFCVSVLNNRNNLFDYLFNLDDLWNLHNFFNKLLHNDWNLNNLFNDFRLRLYDNFLDNRNLSNLNLNVVDYLLNFNNSLDFDNLFNNFFNCYDFWYFFDYFNNSFNDLRNFNYSLNDSLDWDNFLDNVGNDDWHFKWYIDDSFNFSNFFNFNNLFSDFIDSDNLWNFDNSFNNFLDNFLNFNNFRYNSEDFQDIIDINNTHDLLSDHSNNSFVHFEDSTSSDFNFF